MGCIELNEVAKIYPYIHTKGLLRSKRHKDVLSRQRAMPYTTSEGVIVLQHVNIRIQDGEFLVLLGPSGCGKTTLLRLLAGLEAPTTGTIRYDGKDMSGVSPEAHNVAMVFQNLSLYPHFTVFDTIAFPLRNQRMPREELIRTVNQMASLLELQDCMERLPAELSGGQLQRVAIAKALIRRPQLFLMDEPFSNLDAPMRSSMRQLIRRVHRELKTTFVFVTHDQAEALALGTRILVMKDGCIVQDGAPSQIYTTPCCIDAAQALGTPPMNLFSLLPVKNGSVSLWGQQIAVPGNYTGRVSVGIRPVHILLDRNGWQASIEAVEELGCECILHLHTQDSCFTAVVPSNRDSPFFRGQQIAVSFLPEKAFLFREDGLRI